MFFLIKKNHELYHEKLIDLKKDIVLLNTRYTNLKKRALKLKENREENANLLEQHKKKELDDEEKLSAKIVLAETSDKNHRKNKNKIKKATSEPTELDETIEKE
jgi:hypothetical protein